MYKFSQSSGNVCKDGIFDHNAYSGHGKGLDNPDEENVQGIGPIPEGMYTIGPLIYHPKLGADVMKLTPDAENQMFGRSGFYWHGDEILHPGEHLASDGCIISAHNYRVRIARSGDTRLKVIR